MSESKYVGQAKICLIRLAGFSLFMSRPKLENAARYNHNQIAKS